MYDEAQKAAVVLPDSPFFKELDERRQDAAQKASNLEIEAAAWRRIERGCERALQDEPMLDRPPHATGEAYR